MCGDARGFRGRKGMGCFAWATHPTLAWPLFDAGNRVGERAMKDRTIALAGSWAKMVGALLGVAVMIVAVAEGVNAAVCCWQSENDD